MTLKQLGNELKSIGVPVAMHSFARGKAPDLPFIIFYQERSDNFRADNHSYFRMHDVSIELYTSHKNEELENRIRDILERHGFDYYEAETFWPDENMLEVLFETTIYEKGDK